MGGFEETYIVDDEPEMCRSLTQLLATEGVPARSFSSADQLLDSLPYLAPGVIISDVLMPGLSGIDLLGVLADRRRSDPVVIIAGHADVPLAVTALKKGAVDFIEKPFPAELLKVAVAKARQDATAKTADRPSFDRLSHRERQVMELIVAGMTTKEAARSLAISHRTVEDYRAALMSKIGATSVAQLVRIAIAAGIA